MQSYNCVCKSNVRFEALNILMQLISGGELFLLIFSVVAAAVFFSDVYMSILYALM